jgi:hypothetical protein
MSKFTPGSRLYVVHNDNDIVTNRVVLEYRSYAESQKQVDETVTRLLKNTKGVTEWGWVDVFFHEETQNRWPADSGEPFIQ